MEVISKVALVTGGNRGIGLSVVHELASKGFEVIMGCRDEERGALIAGKLQERKLNVIAHELDVENPYHIEEVVKFARDAYGKIDILINNAAVFLDPDWTSSAYDYREETFTLSDRMAIMEKTMRTNVVGAHMVVEAVGDLMAENGYGRIVNVSSVLGQISGMAGGYHAYRISKTALAAITKIFAAELYEYGVLVNAVCPGWRQTEMGGAAAPMAADEGNETIVKLATLPGDGPTGTFWKDGKQIDW